MSNTLRIAIVKFSSLCVMDRITFLSLIRAGIGHEFCRISNNVAWDSIKALAERQGLSAIMLDGLERMPEGCRPSQKLLLEWIGEVLQGYEQWYIDYVKAISSLADFYNYHGYKMMLLKGYACSLDWPKPEHRPCGDIDIWQFGQQKEADEALAASSKFQDSDSKIDGSHHHHTVFEWDGFTVENHYDFVNVYAHKSSRELEKIFKELGRDDSHSVVINGEKVYLPSPNLHALFLIKHMVSHFAAAEINLRQVLDWAFFVEKHTKEIDWVWLIRVIEDFHMKEFANIINSICVDDLGFKSEMFPSVQFNPMLKERVLADILEPEYGTAEIKSLIKRQVYRYKRWQGNAWKQKMCYGESRWSTFWTGVWAKMLKPSSI